MPARNLLAGLHARFGGRAGRHRVMRRGRPVLRGSSEPRAVELSFGSPKPAELSPASELGTVAVADAAISTTSAIDAVSIASELAEAAAPVPLAPVAERPIEDALLSGLGSGQNPAPAGSTSDPGLTPKPSAFGSNGRSGADAAPGADAPGEDNSGENRSVENSSVENRNEEGAAVADPDTPGNGTTEHGAGADGPSELPAGPVDQPPADLTPVDEQSVDEPQVAEAAVDAPALLEPVPAAAEPESEPPSAEAALPAPDSENQELENLELQNTVVAQWNELALQAIREDKPVPTVITRSLHLAHAAMYDAWAAFDAGAAGAYFNPRPVHRRARRRMAEDTQERAVSTAAHHTLSQLFPSHTDRFDGLLDQLGYGADGGRRNHASRVGLRAARTVLRRRANDGSNARNDYADNSGYAPMNDPDDPDLDPNYWTPLKVPNGSAVDENGIPIVTEDPSSYDVQTPLTPHWGQVDPFAISSGRDFRPVAPPQFDDFSPYTDAHGVVSSNDAAYRSQFTEVAQLSAALTPEQKVIAEYWADGPNSSTPPGHWNEFAQDIALREDHGLEQDVKLFFALNNALMDTGIAIWDAKYAHDYVRPQTAIRYLFADEEIAAWGGPNQGTQMIPGSTWQPYQDVTFVTPAFPEYTSGHSGFSYAAASVLEAFTGSDRLYDGISRGAQDLDRDGQPDLIGSYSTDTLAFEQYEGEPISLQWDTVWDAAAEAGRSRLYGGIHIQDGDLRARAMGKAVAEVAWQASEALFTAKLVRRPRRRGRSGRAARNHLLEPVIESVESTLDGALTTASDGLLAASDALNAALNLSQSVENFLN